MPSLRSLPLVSVLAVNAPLVGCGAEQAQLRGPIVEVDADPYDHTTILDEAAMSALVEMSEDGIDLTFIDAGADVNELEPGRILVGMPGAAAPLGLLRRVDAVQRDGDTIHLTTSVASPIHAFRRMHVLIDTRDADPESFRISKSHDVTVPVSWPVFDGDGKTETDNDRITVTGELSAGAGVLFELGFDASALANVKKILDLNPFDVLDEIGFKVRFETELSAAADVTIAGASALDFKDELQLGPPIVVGTIVVPPVVVTPQIRTIARVKGGASTRFEAHFSQEAELELGLTMIGASPPQFTGGVPEFTSGDASATLQADAQVRVSVEPRVEAMLYGLAGPYAGLEPYATLDADVDRDPCWQLAGGLDARFGVFLDLKVISAGASLPVHLTEKTLATGSCLLPPGPGGGSLDPTFEPWARAYEGALASSGIREDRTRITRTHDGRFVLASTNANGLVKVDDVGEVVWAYNYARDIPSADDELRPVSVVPKLDGGLWVAADRGAVLELEAHGELRRAAELDFADARTTRWGDAIGTKDGGMILTLSTEVGEDRDGFVVKFDAAGQPAWTRRFGGGGDEQPTTLMEVPEGFVVAGWSMQTRRHAFVLAPDPTGGLRWFQRLADCEPPPAGGSERHVVVRTSALSEEGRYVFGGHTLGSTYRSLMVSLSPDGEVGFHTELAYPGFLGLDMFHLAPLPSGGYMTVGAWTYSGTGDAVWVAETDAIGRALWVQAYRGGGNDWQTSLMLSPDDNGVLVASGTDSQFVEFPGDGWILKVPRKDGQIELDPAWGIESLPIAPVEQPACMASVPYEGDVTEVVAGLEVVDDVLVTPLAVTSKTLTL